MKIERTLSKTYSFELTFGELEKAHDEYETMYGNSPLYDFIKQEVPFRLQEVLGLEPEKITPKLVDNLVKTLYDNNDIMIDYDKLDEWLKGQVDGGIEDGQRNLWDCGEVFEAGPRVFLCPECRKARLRKYGRERKLKEQHTCIKCKWYEPFSGVCGNGSSPDCADFMDESHYCDAWETKDSLS